jgi:hypothetical protein
LAEKNVSIKKPFLILRITNYQLTIMNSKLDRRNFFRKSAQAGLAGCFLLMNPRLFASENFSFLQNQEKPDPKKLCYCGYKCPANCEMLVASEKNDPELKKKVYDSWKIKENHGVDFDPALIVCFGCKNEDKPKGVLIQKCTVRKCAVEKGFDCCIECRDLVSCQKDLWTRFPKLKEAVVKMQRDYQEAKG